MMTAEERAMAIDADGARQEFTKRMRELSDEYHRDNMSIRERIKEEVTAINRYACEMAALVQE